MCLASAMYFNSLLFQHHKQTISKKENKSLPSPDDTDKVSMNFIKINAAQIILLQNNLYNI